MSLMALEKHLILQLMPHVKTDHFQTQLCIMGESGSSFISPVVSWAPGEYLLKESFKILKTEKFIFSQVALVAKDQKLRRSLLKGGD